MTNEEYDDQNIRCNNSDTCEAHPEAEGSVSSCIHCGK